MTERASAAETWSFESVRPRVWVDIDLAELQRNFRQIARRVSPCSVVAVLKANAYGLEAPPLARALRVAGAAGFAVAELREALPLLDLGLPVQILGSLLPEEIAPAIEAGVILPIVDPDSASRIASVAARLGKRPVCHILVDTGMGRLGLSEREAEACIVEAARRPELRVEGLYSHFPMAYRQGGEITFGQIARFKALLISLERQGIAFSRVHIANSDAINNFPESYQPPFTHVRTGINLHGSFDTEGRRAMSLRSILTLKTRLASVRTVRAGSSIGYGCTFRAPRDMRVGVISAGYADGLPLALSNRGHVLIRGLACPILGRVSMDYTSVSLEQTPNATLGDEVICLGGAGPCAIAVEDWATLKGTHPYEIICSLGSRVVRRFVEGSADPTA